MKWKRIKSDRKWLVIPPVLIGLAAAGVLVAQRRPASLESPQEAVRPVRVIRVPAVDIVPRALGHGTAEPAQVWQAVAEVRGRVMEVHPQLRAGAMIQQDEVLLRIDSAEYELAVSQTEAEIARVEAQLEELAVAAANDRASLEIEADSLAIAEAELRRIESAASQNAASLAERDRQKRAVLTQRQVVQRLQNSLRLVPQQRKSLESELAVKQSLRRREQLDVARAVIHAPFDCRLGDVDIQLDQYLTAGQQLFEAHGTAASEIDAQIPLDQLRTLITPGHGVQAPVMMNPDTVQRLFDFDVRVRYRSGDFRVQWQGRVVRLREQLDPRTRTIGLVVAVDKPYEQAVPGQRPPLVQGMFCEVELRGRALPQRIVIPRAALHDDHVYLVDDENRLRSRPVTVDFAQSSFVCLDDGVLPGQLLVVSDPVPAIDGLLTEPLIDQDVARRLEAAARGETELE